MSAISEALTVGILLTLLVGAISFYLYSRVSYVEKRMGLLENILLDIKAAAEAEEEHPKGFPIFPPFQGGGAPFAPPSGVPAEAPVRPPTPSPEDRVEGSKVEEIREEEFYSSVLEQAHAEPPQEAGPPQGFEPSSPIKELTVETFASRRSEPQQIQVTKISTNYESMTRQELVTIMEQKGLRAPKRAGRSELIQVLKKSEEGSAPASTTETVREEGTIGSFFPASTEAAAPVEGEFAISLGEGEEVSA